MIDDFVGFSDRNREEPFGRPKSPIDKHCKQSSSTRIHQTHYSLANNHRSPAYAILATFSLCKSLLIRKYINYPRYLCLSTIEPPTINEIPALAHHTSTQKIFNSATDVKLSFSVSQ
jgi:hypothetical protein